MPRAAVILLEEEIEQLRDQAGGDDAPEVSNKMAVLAICYHNLGVENEYLRHIPASLDAYQRGVAIARSYLGADNDITKTLVKSCKAAKEHLETAHKRRPESAARGASGPGASGASGPGASGSLGSAYDSMRELRFAQSAGARRAHSVAPSRPGSGMATPQPASRAGAGAGPLPAAARPASGASRAGLDFSRSAPSSRPSQCGASPHAHVGRGAGGAGGSGRSSRPRWTALRRGLAEASARRPPSTARWPPTRAARRGSGRCRRFSTPGPCERARARADWTSGTGEPAL